MDHKKKAPKKEEKSAPLTPMPNPSSITRALPKEAQHIASASIEELGRLAQSVLGYSELRDSIKVEKETLVQLLTRLEVEVLNTDEVVAYMEQRKKAVQERTEKLSTQPHAEDDEEEDYNPRNVRWHETEIKHYEHPIPENVLALAIYIKQHCPNVLLNISTLAAKDPDPFLQVSLGGDSFYLEVWDEPKFTGTLSPVAVQRANLRNKPE